MRQAIPPGERFTLTLRYLPSGNRFRDLQYLYRSPPCTISTIVLETCEAIHSKLKLLYLQQQSPDAISKYPVNPPKT
ncbi:hypothetical protein RRG08_052335 [Elysia crispata]|uniref:Uncharacterized protein n=1 Tax=Elysia crispata TaxID=231223 RepID=A0AAE1DCM9_9GAST|nr:hypothetical protein RRG08_052335 [Elysia crispata]